MNAPARGIPLRPDRDALRSRNIASLARALVSHGRACFGPDTNPHRLCEGTWPDDAGAPQIWKAATLPASTASATALLQSVTEAAVLGAVGAGGTLLGRALNLSFAGAASISLPTLIADASHGSYV